MNWFMVPEHLIFVLCTLFLSIILEAVIISRLTKFTRKKDSENVDEKIEWFRNWWLEFIIYVLATSIVGLFIVSLVKKENITLADATGYNR